MAQSNLTDGEIRESAKAALIAASTLAGARVYASRMDPPQYCDGAGVPVEGVFPHIRVYVLETDDESRTMSGNAFKTSTKVAIEAHVVIPASVELTEDALDDACDPLKQQIREALFCSDWPDQFENTSAMKSMIRLRTAESRIAILLVALQCTHHTVFYRKPTPTTHLTSIHATHHVGDLPHNPAVATIVTLPT